MHALLVREERPVRQPCAFHDKLLAVTAATGLRDVAVIGQRAGLRRAQNSVRVAVTVCAGGGAVLAVLNRASMQAVAVSGVGVGVALAAADFLGRAVRQLLDVRM